MVLSAKGSRPTPAEAQALLEAQMRELEENTLASVKKDKELREEEQRRVEEERLLKERVEREERLKEQEEQERLKREEKTRILRWWWLLTPEERLQQRDQRKIYGFEYDRYEEWRIARVHRKKRGAQFKAQLKAQEESGSCERLAEKLKNAKPGKPPDEEPHEVHNRVYEEYMVVEERVRQQKMLEDRIRQEHRSGRNSKDRSGDCQNSNSPNNAFSTPWSTTSEMSTPMSATPACGSPACGISLNGNSVSHSRQNSHIAPGGDPSSRNNSNMVPGAAPCSRQNSRIAPCSRNALPPNTNSANMTPRSQTLSRNADLQDMNSPVGSRNISHNALHDATSLGPVNGSSVGSRQASHNVNESTYSGTDPSHQHNGVTNAHSMDFPSTEHIGAADVGIDSADAGMPQSGTDNDMYVQSEGFLQNENFVQNQTVVQSDGVQNMDGLQHTDGFQNNDQFPAQEHGEYQTTNAFPTPGVALETMPSFMPQSEEQKDRGAPVIMNTLESSPSCICSESTPYAQNDLSYPQDTALSTIPSFLPSDAQHDAGSTSHVVEMNTPPLLQSQKDSTPRSSDSTPRRERKRRGRRVRKKPTSDMHLEPDPHDPLAIREFHCLPDSDDEPEFFGQLKEIEQRHADGLHNLNPHLNPHSQPYNPEIEVLSGRCTPTIAERVAAYPTDSSHRYYSTNITISKTATIPDNEEISAQEPRCQFFWSKDPNIVQTRVRVVGAITVGTLATILIIYTWKILLISAFIGFALLACVQMIRYGSLNRVKDGARTTYRSIRNSISGKMTGRTVVGDSDLDSTDSDCESYDDRKGIIYEEDVTSPYGTSIRHPRPSEKAYRNSARKTHPEETLEGLPDATDTTNTTPTMEYDGTLGDNANGYGSTPDSTLGSDVRAGNAASTSSDTIGSDIMGSGHAGMGKGIAADLENNLSSNMAAGIEKVNDAVEQGKCAAIGASLNVDPANVSTVRKWLGYGTSGGSGGTNETPNENTFTAKLFGPTDPALAAGLTREERRSSAKFAKQIPDKVVETIDHVGEKVIENLSVATEKVYGMLVQRRTSEEEIQIAPDPGNLNNV